ncbi:hypothetical protein [Ruegeria sp. HKCCD8929]|uniref:hypothetical protein n=1 Tax=Ruegeria sp. HKCCD8929 TaxID=2683006 RepID=UPI001488DF23|nr:hypothetical protein [Ruegeria sp. HKCCD8929]
MSVSSHLVETPEDLAVKVKAWKATEAEIMRFGTSYAQHFEVGQTKPSREQNAIAQDAMEKGYPKYVIRGAGDFLRRIEVAKAAEKSADVTVLRTELRSLMHEFANKIGLGKAFQ